MRKSALFMIIILVFAINASIAFANEPLSPEISVTTVGPWLTTVYEKDGFFLKYQRNSNPEVMTWHVTKLVTGESILDFPCPNRNQEKQPQLVRRIFEIKGVKGVYLNPHAINVVISPAFDRDKVRADIERAILARYGIKR